MLLGARPLLAGLTVSLALAVGASPALAKHAQVAVISVELKGNVAPELRTQIERSITRGVKRARLRMVSAKRLRRALRKTPELQNCTSTACLQRLSEQTGATFFVKATIDGSGAAYTVGLELLSASPDNRVIAQKEIKCAVCTISDLSEKVATTTATLLTAKPKRPVDVVITSRPEGATLRIDDKDAGKSPYTGKLVPGQYRVTALLAGHKETEQTIEVKSDKEAPNRFVIIVPELPKKKPTKPPPPPPPRPYELLKFVTAGASFVAIVGGLVWIARDGDPACVVEPPVTQCMDLHDTGTLGKVTLGVGIGLAAVSAWMWIKDRGHAKPARERNALRGPVLAPTRNGAVIGWRGRF